MKSPSQEPNYQIYQRATGQIVSCACTTRHLGQHYSQVSFESDQWFLRRCNNKKNRRWRAATNRMFLILAQLDIAGNVLTKFQNILLSGLGEDAITSKCLPAHPRSLISAFIVHCLDSIISLDSIAEISRL